jgi:16S rRNA (uracil1498-N3)-methyltransferase
MNIILAGPKEIHQNSLVVTDRRAEHLVKVLRVHEGDTVRVGVIDGLMGKGKVRQIQPRYPFSVTLDLELDRQPVEPPAIDLVLALPRPIMLKRILSQVSALGVGEIHLIHANRVEKSFWKSTVLHPSGYADHLLQGIEQAVDTRVPQVRMHTKFKPFVEDFLPTVIDKYRYAIVAHPGGEQQLGALVRSGEGRVLLAVGPEGGWVDYEVGRFEEAGFTCCSLGARILKVDTAVVALHARISAVREMRGPDRPVGGGCS